MKFNEEIGIKYPILQGGMAHITGGKFASVISNAGALGTIGSGGMKVEKLEEEIKICKENTDKNFAVNLIMLHPNIDKMIELVIKEKVPVVTIGAGYPGEYVKRLSDEGIKVIPVISSPIFARKMNRLNISGYIAEGMEAGGHIGDMTSMVLIPQVKEVSKHPVIAAGGIGSGKQMLAAEILGADAIQIGTGFLLTKECPIHDKYKKALIQASSSKVTVIGNLNGLPTRLIRNKMTADYLKIEKEEEDKIELERLTLGSLKKAVLKGDIVDGSLMTGLVVGQFNEILTVKEFIEKIIKEYKEAKECLLK